MINGENSKFWRKLHKKCNKNDYSGYPGSKQTANGKFISWPEEILPTFLFTGVEDEIQTSPKYIQGAYQESRSSPEQFENNERHQNNQNYEQSMDEVTYDDLRPDRFDNNHPDTIDFRIPSHNELQKKYKTVSTSASELVEDVIGKLEAFHEKN